MLINDCCACFILLILIFSDFGFLISVKHTSTIADFMSLAAHGTTIRGVLMNTRVLPLEHDEMSPNWDICARDYQQSMRRLSNDEVLSSYHNKRIHKTAMDLFSNPNIIVVIVISHHTISLEFTQLFSK